MLGLHAQRILGIFPLFAATGCSTRKAKVYITSSPAGGQPVRRSVAAKEASGDRVFWTVWAPNEVVDWHFDQSGKLIWVITEQSVYDNSDFTQPAGSRQVRTIWQKGGGVRLWLNEKNREKIDLEEPFTTTLDDVGFVPVGTPIGNPVVV